MNAITVVITTFNRRERLQNAVESVLLETRVPINVHIFDDASTDDTEGYVTQAAAKDDRIIYFRNPRNVGSIKNYSQALGSVKSSYYVPLADDDLLLPNFLFDAFHILEAYKDAGAAIFLTEARNEAGSVVGTFPPEPEKIQFGLLQPRQLLRDWMSYGHCAWSSILWRRETLDFIGFPYLHTELASHLDFQFQIFCNFPVYFVNKPGAVYLLHADQSSRTSDATHVPAWSKVFTRMDRAIFKLGIVEKDEYLRLREIVQQRYKAVWNPLPASPLDYKRLVPTAALAGARLGDWTLAFSLLDQADEKRENPNVGLMHSILRCLRSERMTIDRLESELDQLRFGLAEADERKREAEGHAARALEDCAAMRASTSWRLTKPLRLLSGAFRDRS